MTRGRRPWRWALPLAAGLAAASCSTGGHLPITTTAAPGAGPATAPPVTTTTVPVPADTAGTTSQAEMPATLLVWVDQAREAVAGPAAAAFEAATGIPVVVEVIGLGDIRRRMLEQAPLGGGADLFVGSHESVGALVGEHLLEPIDLGASAGDFLPVGLEAFSVGGRLYGVPYALEAVALYRNTALAPEAPATFDDLLAVCEDLGGEADPCLALPAGDPYYAYPFLASPGGYIFGYDPDAGYDPGDVGLDDEGAVAGMSLLGDLVARGVVDPAVDYGTMTGRFFQGRAAFMWTAAWAVPDADAAVAAATLPGYAVSPLPEILGHEAVPLVHAQGFMVNAYSEHKALAQQFLLNYLATGEAMQALYDAEARSPAHLAVFESLAGEPDARAFAVSAAAGRPVPNIPEMSVVWAPLQAAVEAVFGGTAGPAEALSAAAAAVREALAGE